MVMREILYVPVLTGPCADIPAFIELLSLAALMEKLLAKSGVPRSQEGVVSLLCPTGLDFLVGWIALMRMGYGVVFTAYVHCYLQGWS
jgi:hypothetical protein